MRHHRLLIICWLTLNKGASVVVNGQLDGGGGEEGGGRGGEGGSNSVNHQEESSNPTLLLLSSVSPSMAATFHNMNYVSVAPHQRHHHPYHNNNDTVAPSSSSTSTFEDDMAAAPTESRHLQTVHPFLVSPTSYMSTSPLDLHSHKTLEENTAVVSSAPTVTSYRGDLPLHLDSEENEDGMDQELLFHRPTYGSLLSSIESASGLNVTDTASLIPNDDDSSDITDIPVNNQETEFDGTLSLTNNNGNFDGTLSMTNNNGNFDGTLPTTNNKGNFDGTLSMTDNNGQFDGTLSTTKSNSNFDGTLSMTNNNANFDGTLSMTNNNGTSRLFELDSQGFTNVQKSSEESGSSTYSQNTLKVYPDSVIEVEKRVPTPQPLEVITVYTSSPLELHEKWTWFFMILRGNCHLIDLKNSYVLFYDFTKSFSALLLYNREHILIDSMTCSNRRMTVNMSIDSSYYPNCEKDIKTLLDHANLRINLHNTSFYIHSYETKRTSIFETKNKDVEEENHNSDILYMTLGGVGISLICIILAAILFAIYQRCVVKKTTIQHLDASAKFISESPRSLKPKFQLDQSMSFSDQRTYSVNMYKSYSDLTAPDLYSHLGSPKPPSKENLPKTTILTKIPKEKNKKKKKKKRANESGLYGFNDCESYQEFWSERITQIENEDYMTVRNLNTMTSSFRTNGRGLNKEPYSPLLKKGMPTPMSQKQTKNEDDLPLPPPPPLPTTCPSSPAMSRDVLERMDHLIANDFSNSSPDVNVCSAYTRTYSNTTINVSNASTSGIFGSVPSNQYNTNTVSTPQNLTKMSSSASTANMRAPPQSQPQPPPPLSSTSASAENLCLTRITFMEMCVWPQHSTASQLSLRGPLQRHAEQV